MAYAQSDWPPSGKNEGSGSASYFPSLDENTLTPNLSSTYGPTASFHVVSGSELPSRRRTSHLSPSSPSHRRKPSASASQLSLGLSDESSAEGRVISPNAAPLTRASTIIKAHGKAPPRPEEVWREMLKTAYGRDKTFKIFQYTMKVLLLLHSGTKSYLKGPLAREIVKRMTLTVAHLSITRKCLILFNWITPMIHILNPDDSSLPFATSAVDLGSPTVLHRLLHAPPPVLLDLFNGLFDDMATLFKLGLIGPKLGERAARYADWFWFASTIAGLVETGAERSMVNMMRKDLEARQYKAEMEKGTDLSVVEENERELEKLKKQYGWLRISRTKLLMDLIFVSYDIFKFRRAPDTVKVSTGLMAALLSTYKMYDSQQRQLSKTKF